MARKLTTKEKLYLFELSDDTIQKIHAPRYTDEFAEDSITEKEFKEMVKDRQLHYRLVQHLNRCENQLQSFRNYWNLRKSFDEQVKKDILPHLYNGDEEIAEFYQPIRPVVVELLNKFLADEELTNADLDKLYASSDKNTYLVVEAFEELLHRERKIQQCAAENCKKLFIPTPPGHKQIYCSNACKMREYRKRKKNA